MSGTGPHHTQDYSVPGLSGRIETYAELGSTNTRLRELASSGAPEGTVVVADAQTAGRGRHGRTWNSPAGAGLYASVLVRPDVAAGAAQMLTLAAAVAVAEALAELGVRDIEVKWPNDVLAGGRKVCGILTEAGLIGERVDAAIVGIGVNVLDEAVPEDLHDRATSLAGEGVRAEPMDVMLAVLARLGALRGALSDPADGRLLARWRELAPSASGRHVAVDDGKSTYDAVTDGVTPAGFLRVRCADGTVRELTAADVTLRH